MVQSPDELPTVFDARVSQHQPLAAWMRVGPLVDVPEAFSVAPRPITTPLSPFPGAYRERVTHATTGPDVGLISRMPLAPRS